MQIVELMMMDGPSLKVAQATKITIITHEPVVKLFGWYQVNPRAKRVRPPT